MEKSVFKKRYPNNIFIKNKKLCVKQNTASYLDERIFSYMSIGVEVTMD